MKIKPEHSAVYHNYVAVLDHYEVPIDADDSQQHADEWDGEEVALVEHSRYGQTWITLWASAELAWQYHIGQEYPEDWTDHTIIDLVSKEEVEVLHTRPTFVPVRTPSYLVANRVCTECWRVFHLWNPVDADEWANGHDCEG